MFFFKHFFSFKNTIFSCEHFIQIGAIVVIHTHQRVHHLLIFVMSCLHNYIWIISHASSTLCIIKLKMKTFMSQRSKAHCSKQLEYCWELASSLGVALCLVLFHDYSTLYILLCLETCCLAYLVDVKIASGVNNVILFDPFTDVCKALCTWHMYFTLSDMPVNFFHRT